MSNISKLKGVEQASVYKSGVRAATLQRDEAGLVSFYYESDYSGSPVASTLPLSQEVQTVPGGGLPPFFAGLLPEGHRLQVLRRALKTSLDDEFSLLLAVGQDMPGDVQVIAKGWDADVIAPAISGDTRELDFLELTGVVDRHGLPGVQEKVSASLMNVPMRFSGKPALLKLGSSEYPDLVRNEFMHLAAARKMGLPVANAVIVKDCNELEGLVIERFDREGEHRLPMEDGAQALGIYPAAKYNPTSEDVTRALSVLCSAPMVAARALFMQLAFAWLTGNGDVHAKNLSVLQDSQGRWKVAPIYDVPSTIIYGDMTMALSIAGRSKNIRARHWYEFASAVGLPSAVVRGAVSKVIGATQGISLSELAVKGSSLRYAERELRHRKSEALKLLDM